MHEGTDNMALHLTLTHDDSYQSLLQSTVDRLAKRLSLDKRHLFQVNLILDEICTNIVDNNRKNEQLHVDIEISWNTKKITIVIEDNGVPFDPTSVAEPDTSLPLSRREAGGLGLYFVKQYSDTFEYLQLKGCNRTIVSIRIGHPKPSSTTSQ